MTIYKHASDKIIASNKIISPIVEDTDRKKYVKNHFVLLWRDDSSIIGVCTFPSPYCSKIHRSTANSVISPFLEYSVRVVFDCSRILDYGRFEIVKIERLVVNRFSKLNLKQKENQPPFTSTAVFSRISLTGHYLQQQWSNCESRK